MQNFLAVTVLGSYNDNLIEKISTAIKDCGCNIVDARMNTMGQEIAMLMLLSGTWDTIAKMESQFEKLENRLELTIIKKRTENQAPNSQLMPYAIDLVSYDHIGVVNDIAKFLADNNISIQDMNTNSYSAVNTGTPMFTLHMTVNIPVDISIASIRGDFMDFCEKLNLDAILEPVK